MRIIAWSVVAAVLLTLAGLEIETNATAGNRLKNSGAPTQLPELAAPPVSVNEKHDLSLERNAAAILFKIDIAPAWLKSDVRNNTMKTMLLRSCFIVSAALVGGFLHAAEPSVPLHPTVQFVTVDTGVKLEVVDWGGKGPTVVMLAGLGADAHEFDNFAPQLADKYHVLGITRRGFGASSKPDTGYSNARLGQDVIAVLDALKIQRAAFVGHSMAGMELSWIGTHAPGRVYGLAYIEAAYAYAYYSESSSDPQNLIIDSLELKKLLRQLPRGGGRPDRQRLTAELIAEVGRFARELREYAEMIKDDPDPPLDPANPPHPPVSITGIYQGLEKYTKIEVPVLAIFAVPHALGDLGDPEALAKNPTAAAKLEALDIQRTGSQADAFERGVPQARVVRIPHASHYILGSNEQDVLREIRMFLERLSP